MTRNGAQTITSTDAAAADAGSLARIAEALARLAPAAHAPVNWLTAPAYVWEGDHAREVPVIVAPALALLHGIDAQKRAVTDNVLRLAAGHAAHDMLLWGSRGMGKSALLRASVMAAQADDPAPIALVQLGQTAVAGFAGLFGQLSALPRRFLVFIDDLGFEADDGSGPRLLRSLLEGGVEARPANVRLAVTSNRRAIVSRHSEEQDGALNPRDAVDDALALADRFGLSIGFHNCDQDTYLAIVAGYAQALVLPWDQAEALEWSRRRGARSGRVAWQFITEIAGRAGRPL